MRRITFFLSLLVFASCGSHKKTTHEQDRTISVAAADEVRRGVESNHGDTFVEDNSKKHGYASHSKADAIINTALTFSGVRYKYGGTTRKGMDCSGLLYVAFSEHDIALPRTSSSMAERGKRIRVNDVAKGDLLFFKTTRGSKRINHVGMVVKVEQDEVKFIHASTSRGVTISSLREGFWNHAFVKATRIL